MEKQRVGLLVGAHIFKDVTLLKWLVYGWVNGDQGVLRNGMWRFGHCVSLGTPHNFVCRFFAKLESLALPVA